jgi:formate hydrogenlyase transcriptional activator
MNGVIAPRAVEETPYRVYAADDFGIRPRSEQYLEGANTPSDQGKGDITMATLNLVGSSAKFRALLDNIDLVAPVDSAVLIQGETGTGKEMIARAIHEVSPRRRNRFVALNCAAIPAALLESELFGYEKGAFTGAANQTIGRFQVADRGTLFLDEIGDLPLELQPKLLRALQEKQFERLGGSQTVHIDVRVIAATNQDLGQMVRERRFRADLYYRLNVFPMTLPPLRERRDDIALLTEYFVRKFADQQGKLVATIPRDVMAALEHYDWPGNIRELQNVIERGVIMTTDSELSRQTTELLTRSDPAPAEATSITTTMADAERAHISATLRATNWVVGGRNGAAARLGLPRTTLLARMQRLGISNLSRRRSGRSIERFVQVMGGLSCLKDESAGLRVMEAAVN